MSIKSKIQSLISAANTATGESDATLTDAVQTLVDGYGQGGGGEENSEIVTVGANDISNVVQAETYLKGLSTLDFTSNKYSIEIETGYTTPTYNQIGGIIRYVVDNTNVTIAQAVRYRNSWSTIQLLPSYDALLAEGTKYKVVVLE